jgi:hypothetical protein
MEVRGSPNRHQTWRKTSNNKANPEKWNYRYPAAGKGIWLNFLADSEPAFSFFKTAGFNRSRTPALLILAHVLDYYGLQRGPIVAHFPFQTFRSQPLRRLQKS